MNDTSNSDIEAHMGQFNDFPLLQSDKKKKLKNFPGKMDPGAAMFINFTLKRNDNYKYQIIMMLFSLIKIVATSVIFSQTGEAHPVELEVWLVAIMAYDLLNIIIRYPIMRNLYLNRKKKQIKNPPIFPRDEAGSLRFESGLFRSSLMGFLKNQDSFKEREEKQKLLINLLHVTRFLYTSLFVWSQFIAFMPLEDDKQPSNARIILFYVYMCFGYVYFGLPILLFFISFLYSSLCLRCMAFCLRKIQKRKSAVIPGASPTENEDLKDSLQNSQDLSESNE